MVQRKIFLKGGAGTFLFNFFEVCFYSLKNCVRHLKKNYLFSATVIYEKIHSKLSENESVCMCKEVWFVRLRQEGGCLRESGETV